MPSHIYNFSLIVQNLLYLAIPYYLIRLLVRARHRLYSQSSLARSLLRTSTGSRYLETRLDQRWTGRSTKHGLDQRFTRGWPQPSSKKKKKARSESFVFLDGGLHRRGDLQFHAHCDLCPPHYKCS